MFGYDNKEKSISQEIHSKIHFNLSMIGESTVQKALCSYQGFMYDHIIYYIAKKSSAIRNIKLVQQKY